MEQEMILYDTDVLLREHLAIQDLSQKLAVHSKS